MDKGTQQIAKRLLMRIHTSASLSTASEKLESITQNKTLKGHANLIVTDPHLSFANKRTQLLYLIRSVDLPLLNDFFSDELNPDTIWLFHTDKIDYFDRFVQSFQRLTETVRVVHLVTVIPLSDLYLRQIATNFATSFGYQIIIDHEVNPSLIGGIQVRLDNYVFDYSLRSRFAQFQRQWVNSIQTLEDTVLEPPQAVQSPST